VVDTIYATGKGGVRYSYFGYLTALRSAEWYSNTVYVCILVVMGDGAGGLVMGPGCPGIYLSCFRAVQVAFTELYDMMVGQYLRCGRYRLCWAWAGLEFRGLCKVGALVGSLG